jgi:hypothetical protein
MYADDIILLSKSAKGLQEKLKQGTYSYVKQFNFDPSMYYRIKILF